MIDTVLLAIIAACCSFGADRFIARAGCDRLGIGRGVEGTKHAVLAR